MILKIMDCVHIFFTSCKNDDKIKFQFIINKFIKVKFFKYFYFMYFRVLRIILAQLLIFQLIFHDRTWISIFLQFTIFQNDQSFFPRFVYSLDVRKRRFAATQIAVPHKSNALILFFIFYFFLLCVNMPIVSRRPATRPL